jgi:hypothetical protein
MADFEAVIEQATRRLRMDRELRMEVGHELRTHLEDSAAAFAAGGDDEAKAMEQAVKALGDPEDLAQRLWTANRGRLRLRAVAWWGLRLTLLPACVVAIVMFMFANFTTSWMYSSVRTGPDMPAPNWAERYREKLKEKMTPRQELIFFGDETAETELGRWRGLRDAYPESALYQLHYISVFLQQKLAKGEPEVVEELFEELERGRRLEPENGVYDLLEAAVWFRRAGEWKEDESRSLMFIRHYDGEMEESHPGVFVTRDEAALTEAVAAFGRAVGKPYITMHALEMLEHRVAQLPPAVSITDYLHRVGAAVNTLLPTLGYEREVAWAVSGRAQVLAEEGKREEALALLDDVEVFSAKRAASSEALMELLVAQAVRVLALHSRAFVYQALGDAEAQEEAVEASNRQAEAFYQIYHGRDGEGTSPVAEKGGVFISTLLPALPGYQIDYEPFRDAEYAMADRAALTLALIVLVAAALLLSVGAMGQLWRTRKKKEEQPMLLWLGWKRLAVVLGAGVLIPLVLFEMWTCAAWSGREYGINYYPMGVFGYVPALGLMIGLLVGLGAWLFVQRGREVGLPAEVNRRWLWAAGIFGAVTLLPMTVFELWVITQVYHEPPEEVVGLSAAVLAVFCLWLALASLIIGLKNPERPWRALGKAAAWSVGATVVVAGLVALVLWTTALVHPMDRWVVFFILSIAAVVLGLAFGLVVLTQQRGRTGPLGASVVRSMAMVFGLGALLLAVVGGPMLTWRERAAVGRMVAVSPVFMDREIEDSDLRFLRSQLAEGVEPAPKLEP